MSWLARIEVSAKAMYNQGVIDNYSLHKRLWECFPDMPYTKRDFLTRVDRIEGAFRLWVLAKSMPMKPKWCVTDSFAVKEISSSFLTHQYFAFDLRVNPVKNIVQRDSSGKTILRANGKHTLGKRVPLVKPEELRAWLVRKGTVRCRDKDTGLDVPGGFKIVEEKPLEISPMVENHFRKSEHVGYHGGVQFRGILEVTDQNNFTETYHSGLGSAKGFGFGLMLLAPVTL